ncbi:MAG: hypothetical protein ABIO67_03810 [Mycobacteriales bacterium]
MACSAPSAGDDPLAVSDPTSASTSASASSSAPGQHRSPRLKPDPVDDPELKVLAEYRLSKGTLPDGTPSRDARIWNRFRSLFPALVTREIAYFVALDGPRSGDVDGAMQLSALNDSDFYLALDVTGMSTPAELDRTMIHEFAHLLTLRGSQISPDEAANRSCRIYTNELGCPEAGSYLYDWDTAFWKGYTVADSDAERGNDKLVQRRFERGGYVTEYAATDPAEDLAETFSEWVLGTSHPDGGTTVRRKLAFFDNYPEALKIRAHVRSVLG